MKTTSVLAAAAALMAATTSAQEVTAADKALWIDRHNYFRMTALPFAAANMLKVKWSDDLATAAAAEAKGCAAATGAGVNAFTHTAATPIVDAAFQEWVVAAAIKALPSIKAPKVAGDAVGTGVYNSYSQVIWSATSQVGCGYATCTAGKLVVCKYAAPGNSAGEPWYVHGPPNTQCPAGTEGKLGLCIVPGDAGNNDIAPIPAGQNAYDVFASFMGTVQKLLKGEAVDGGPMTGTTASTNPGAAATAAAAAGAGGPMTGTSASTNPGTTAATTAAPAAGAATAPAAGAATAPAAGAATAPAAGAATAPAAGAAAATTTSTAPATDSTGVAAVPAGATSGSAAAGAAGTAGAAGAASTATTTTDATKSIGFGSLTSGSGAAPGTVHVGSNTGSTFTNEAKASGTAATAANAAATPAAAITPQKAESTTGGSGTANNKSSGEADSESHFSAAGVAGAIVVGCVMIAGVAVFVSYRKNQRRQRDIMQNGGIHIL